MIRTRFIHIVTLSLAVPHVALAQFGDAMAQYHQEHYQEAESALGDSDDAAARRLRGLIHYHQLHYQTARPLLEEAYAANASDREVLTALVAVLIEAGEAKRADTLIDAAEREAPLDAPLLQLAGRAAIARSDNRAAIARFEQALAADAQLPDAATDLAKAYLRGGKITKARHVIDDAIQGANDFEAAYLKQTLPGRPRGERLWSATIAYRIQTDDNVVLLPDVVQATGKADIRYVLSADAAGHYPIAPDWTLLGEAHAYQSLHQELGRLDETHLNLVGGAGWTQARYGLRLPVEATVIRIGDTALSEWRVTPGAYVNLPRQVTLYGFGAAGYDDYRLAVFDPDERRSGNVRALGAVAVWDFLAGRGNLRGLIESTRYDTDGANWQRSEQRFYINAYYKAPPRLTVGAAFERRNLDFDNLNSVYLVTRGDQIDALSLLVTYALNPQLALQAAYSHVNADSDIEVYGYTRQVLSLGAAWRF